MPVKHQAEVIDKAALAQIDGCAVDQIAGLDQQFGGGQTGAAPTLVQEHPVMLAHDQIAGIADGAGHDHHRRETADRAQPGMADPAHRLAAMVAGQDLGAGLQRLDRALFAGAERDHRAARKRQAEHIGQMQPLGRGLDRQEGIVDPGADR